jgi:N-acetylglucosaminyldiphosphoundecaprenol N-acetyl-beta-D-mannosaminyltransferase
MRATRDRFPPAPPSALAEQPPAPPPSAAVLGIPLAITDYAQVIEWIDATIAAGSRGSISAAAVHLVMRAQDEPAVMEAVLGLSLVVPDGQPLVWALHALGHQRATRVYGPDLMALYCQHAAHTGVPIYLYGGRSEDALVELTLALRTRFPGLAVVGGHAPPFRELSAEEDEQEALAIERSGAQVVWVGIGQPRQELWVARMRERLDTPVLIAVGAAFDFHAGLLPQAPAWMGSHGLEWSYRLAREPRRLWRRYARYNPRFVIAFARQYAAVRRRGR